MKKLLKTVYLFTTLGALPNLAMATMHAAPSADGDSPKAAVPATPAQKAENDTTFKKDKEYDPNPKVNEKFKDKTQYKTDISGTGDSRTATVSRIGGEKLGSVTKTKTADGYKVTNYDASGNPINSTTHKIVDGKDQVTKKDYSTENAARAGTNPNITQPPRSPIPFQR